MIACGSKSLPGIDLGNVVAGRTRRSTEEAVASPPPESPRLEGGSIRSEEAPASPRPPRSPRLSSEEKQRYLSVFVEAGKAGVLDELQRSAGTILTGKTDSGARDHRGHVPSELSNFYVWRDYQQGEDAEYLCYVPQTAVPPLPVTLLYKPFANFTTNLNDRLEARDIQFASEFWKELHDPLYETDHRKKVYLMTKHLIRSYLGFVTQPYAKLFGDVEVDGVLIKDRVPVVIWEWMSQSGSSGDPYFKGLDYVKRSASEDPDEQTYTLVVFVEGRILHVLAASFEGDNRVWAEPLAITTCYGGYEWLEATARIWRAIRLFVQEVTSLPRSSSPAKPWLLKQRAMLQRPLDDKLFFTYLNQDGKPEAAKFVSSTYSEEAHRAWGEFAPEFRGVEGAGARWSMVRMEYLAPELGWECAEELVKKLELKKLHSCIAVAADAGHSKGFVHGDMRLCNIMVRSGAVLEEDGLPSFQVRFVDFDWAGVENEAVYPRRLNPEVNWASGAEYGAKIAKDHDIHFLNSLLETERMNNF